MAEVKKDVHLSEFAWILRPMEESMQTLWMSGEFVADNSAIVKSPSLTRSFP